MPKKKQPSTLEDIAAQKIGDIVCDRCTYAVLLVPPSMWCEQERRVFLKTHVEWMKEVYLSYVSRFLIDRIVDEVLLAVARYIPCTKEHFIQNMMICLEELGILSQIKFIEHRKWPVLMKRYLYDGLDKLSGLEVLDLTVCLESAKFLKQALKNVHSLVNLWQSLTNLVDLCLFFKCSDQILSVVCENCLKLQCLDVGESVLVTDSSVPSLLYCTGLRKLILYNTSITVPACGRVLLTMQYLENFSYNKFGDVLQYIETDEQSNIVLNIKTFRGDVVSGIHFQLLSSMCPKIELATVDSSKVNGDLTPFSSLTNLHKLELVSSFNRDAEILLNNVGQQLTSLILVRAFQLDLEAIVLLNYYCPNLEKLMFDYCEFSNTLTCSLLRPFRKLEFLSCFMHCSLIHLEVLLTQCVNVRCVHLETIPSIDDETMEKVLSKHALSHLEQFRIPYSDVNLTMRTVRLLMDHCENLKVLSDLEMWDGLTKRQLADFRAELQANNIDLDTSSHYCDLV